MSATMVAKDLAAGHGDRALFSGLDLVVAPGDVIGLVGRERRRQVDAAAYPRRAAAGRGTARVTLSPPTATVGHLPQEPERRPGETVRGLPGPPHRGRRRAGARWTRPTEALAAGAAGRRRRVRRRRWSAGSPSAAPTWTSGPSRSPPSWASPSTWTTR